MDLVTDGRWNMKEKCLQVSQRRCLDDEGAVSQGGGRGQSKCEVRSLRGDEDVVVCIDCSALGSCRR